MEKSSQIAWKIVPLRHFFPLKVVPLIGVLLYCKFGVGAASITVSSSGRAVATVVQSNMMADISHV
jgi:hypothetical protein